MRSFGELAERLRAEGRRQKVDAALATPPAERETERAEPLPAVPAVSGTGADGAPAVVSLAAPATTGGVPDADADGEPPPGELPPRRPPPRPLSAARLAAVRTAQDAYRAASGGHRERVAAAARAAGVGIPTVDRYVRLDVDPEPARAVSS